MTEKEEWTYQKLSSDIGGQTDIWIGASTFSLVEIFAFLIQMLTSLFQRNSEGPTRTKSTQILSSF